MASRQGRRISVRIQCLSVDTTDPARLAAFWQEALGSRQTFAPHEEIELEPPAGGPDDGIVPTLLFLRVPEAKTVKNRLHIDLRRDDQAAEVRRLESLGATKVDVGQKPDAT